MPSSLRDIAISSAETAQSFGIEPRVAMLSYSTGESGKGADVDKVKEATRIAKQLRPDLKLEGPIQYDAAVDPDVAKVKLPGSEVAGRATVFIFPDLNAGNNAYKAVQRAANAIAIGPVLQGLNKPVNDLSRGCSRRRHRQHHRDYRHPGSDRRSHAMRVAVINCGSSSVKYEVFGLPDCTMLATGLIEKIGTSEGRMRQRRRNADGSFDEQVDRSDLADHREAFELMAHVNRENRIIQDESELFGVGHRVVHGGEVFREPT